MSDAQQIGGSIRRWRDGKILYIANDFVTMAYVVSGSKHYIGRVGWDGNPGEPHVWVEYISWKDAAAWRGVGQQPRASGLENEEPK